MKKLQDLTVEELIDLYPDAIQDDTDIESRREVLHDILTYEANCWNKKYLTEEQLVAEEEKDAYYANMKHEDN